MSTFVNKASCRGSILVKLAIDKLNKDHEGKIDPIESKDSVLKDPIVIVVPPKDNINLNNQIKEQHVPKQMDSFRPSSANSFSLDIDLPIDDISFVDNILEEEVSGNVDQINSPTEELSTNHLKEQYVPIECCRPNSANSFLLDIDLPLEDDIDFDGDIIEEESGNFDLTNPPESKRSEELYDTEHLHDAPRPIMTYQEDNNDVIANKNQELYNLEELNCVTEQITQFEVENSVSHDSIELGFTHINSDDETNENFSPNNQDIIQPVSLTKKGLPRKRKPKQITPTQLKQMKMERSKNKHLVKTPCSEKCKKGASNT